MTLHTATIGAAIATVLLASPAIAHDCAGRIDEFERLRDIAAKEAISASSGGQAVAGAREAQAAQDSGAATDAEETGTSPKQDSGDPVVPFQDEAEEAAAVEETDESANAGENVIDARTQLQEARELAESGNEETCTEALDKVIVHLIAK